MDHLPPRPDAAERTERHLAAVAELADCALQLAREAARKALAHAEAERQAQAAGLPPPALPRPAGPDPADAFCRMSREVCRLIVMEMRLAGRWRDSDRDRRRAARVEPRRTRLRSILHEAVVIPADGPDDATMLETIEDALEDDDIEEMLADGAPVGDVLVEVCRRFGLMVDSDSLPDDALSTRTLPRPYRSSVSGFARPEQGPDPP